MYLLNQELYFPPVDQASREGILAIGGDLSPERLELAYRSGIFPWFNDDDPIVWWAPPERMVLLLDHVAIPKSMRSILRRDVFTITYNENFWDVIRMCQTTPREGQAGTWITDDMVDAYCELHDKGLCKSVEVWQDGVLVGGLYGVDLGHVFCGESMFSLVPNASKAAFFSLATKLSSEGYKLLDCQVYNDHLATLGCVEIPRADFMKILAQNA